MHTQVLKIKVATDAVFKIRNKDKMQNCSKGLKIRRPHQRVIQIGSWRLGRKISVTLILAPGGYYLALG